MTAPIKPKPKKKLKPKKKPRDLGEHTQDEIDHWYGDNRPDLPQEHEPAPKSVSDSIKRLLSNPKFK